MKLTPLDRRVANGPVDHLHRILACIAHIPVGRSPHRSALFAVLRPRPARMDLFPAGIPVISVLLNSKPAIDVHGIPTGFGAEFLIPAFLHKVL